MTVAASSAVARMRPRSSITAATCTSLWVSTPPRTRRPTPDCAIVVMPLLPHHRPRGWHDRRAGGQDSDRALAQAPLRSRSPNRCVRCAGPRSPGRLITSKAPNPGPADLRVRPSERDPARSLPARQPRPVDHHCRSGAPAVCILLTLMRAFTGGPALTGTAGRIGKNDAREEPSSNTAISDWNAVRPCHY